MNKSNDLLLAILSIDAYNRGYGAGIELDGLQVGKARHLNAKINPDKLS